MVLGTQSEGNFKKMTLKKKTKATSAIQGPQIFSPKNEVFEGFSCLGHCKFDFTNFLQYFERVDKCDHLYPGQDFSNASHIFDWNIRQHTTLNPFGNALVNPFGK